MLFYLLLSLLHTYGVLVIRVILSFVIAIALLRSAGYTCYSIFCYRYCTPTECWLYMLFYLTLSLLHSSRICHSRRDRYGVRALMFYTSL